MDLFLLFVIVWFILLMYFSNRVESKRTIIVVALVTILLYWGFSYINADDMDGYIMFFNTLSVRGWVLDSLWGTPAGDMEPGLFIIMQWCKRLNSSYFFFQFIMLSINVIITYWGLSKIFNSRNCAIIFLLLFTFDIAFFMSAMRQGVAIAIMIVCLSLFVDNKWKIYIPLLVMAIFFHQSAIILFLIPLFWFILNKIYIGGFLKKLPFILFIFCNVMYFMGITAGKIIENSFGNLVYDSAISTTRTLSIEGNMAESNFGVMKVIELDICYVIFLLTNIVKKNKYLQLVGGLLFVFFLLNMLVGGIIIHRVNYYLTIPYYIALFTSLYSLLNVKFHIVRPIAYAVIFLYMLMLYFVQDLSSEFYKFEYNLFDIL